MSHIDTQFFKDFVSQVFAGQDEQLHDTEEKLKGSKKIRSEQTAELELALCVLLVDLASCDEHFDQAEYALISKALRQLFGTSGLEVSHLVNRANLALANLRGLGQFAEILRDTLSPEQKQSVATMIDDIIAADGHEDGFEIHVRSKLHALLGMS